MDQKVSSRPIVIVASLIDTKNPELQYEAMPELELQAALDFEIEIEMRRSMQRI